jgi:hypothetical protein
MRWRWHHPHKGLHSRHLLPKTGDLPDQIRHRSRSPLNEHINSLDLARERTDIPQPLRPRPPPVTSTTSQPPRSAKRSRQPSPNPAARGRAPGRCRRDAGCDRAWPRPPPRAVLGDRAAPHRADVTRTPHVHPACHPTPSQPPPFPSPPPSSSPPRAPSRRARSWAALCDHCRRVRHSG